MFETNVYDTDFYNREDLKDVYSGKTLRNKYFFFVV